jgi:predicted Fe-S protein YdhL (DUF1289 family)
MNTSSPCIQVCELDDSDVCIGCGRTREEIARWTQMSDAEKARVHSIVTERQFRAAKAVTPVADAMS